jgi:hypothetical protein
MWVIISPQLLASRIPASELPGVTGRLSSKTGDCRRSPGPGATLPARSWMPAVRTVPAAEAALGGLAAPAATRQAVGGGNLPECFRRSRPGAPAGIRHSLAGILAMCMAAVLCGCGRLEDVTAWAGSAARTWPRSGPAVLGAGRFSRTNFSVCQQLLSRRAGPGMTGLRGSGRSGPSVNVRQ